MTGRTLAGLFMAALAAFAGGCSTESTPTDTEGVSGNPSLTIVSVNGVDPDDGLCVEVPEGPDPTIPIVVSTAAGTHEVTVELRPPGYCAVLEETQCGHLVALVNGVPNSSSATRVILVHLGQLANHYADLTIAIGVVDDLGKPLLTNGDAGTREPLVRSVKVRTSKACPKLVDAGDEGG